jgi:hypothetical protein
MITNKGKAVLAKYLIGQAPSYASHIAFGCGPAALQANAEYTQPQQDEFADKTALDFEMFRAPIISRGYVTENVLDENGDIVLTTTNGPPVTISQIVFTAELPTDERYEITEMGIFSAGANPSAGATDSKILNTFAESENWEYHYKSGESYPATKIPIESGKLDNDVDDAIDDDLDVFRVNADNPLFANNQRVNRNERCRFFNSMLLVSGDSCKVYGNTDATLNIRTNEDNSHIHFNGINFNLDRNAGTDVIKVGLSIINRVASGGNPTSAKIIVEFASPETSTGTSAQYARLKKIVTGDFTNNRYYVVSDTLENLEKSSGFSWGAVSVVKVYVSVLANSDETSFSDQFFVALDAIRLENLTIVNPLYGLTAYTVVKNENALPIVKNINSATLAEFRFGIDVLGGI